MSFNEFVVAALSNDIVCIMDDVYSHDGKIIEEPRPAYKWIDDPVYANREIDRFTLVPRKDQSGRMIAVSLKEEK